MLTELFTNLREKAIASRGVEFAEDTASSQSLYDLRELERRSLFVAYQELLDFSDAADFAATKEKKCSKGYSCGKSCISPGKNCRLNVEGQAKEFTNFLKTSSGQSVPVLRSGVADVPISELNLDPQRFQYKLVHGKSGSSGSLTGVKKFDPELAGIVQVWQDPADGRTYVINGHNRVNLAKDTGQKDMTVRYIKANTPEEARATGALTNIAEGRGNALDAAKFFRDTGLTQKDLEGKGIPLREKIATDGLALASLNEGLFQRVALGEMPVERAVVIGSQVKDPQLQSDLVGLIEQNEKKGKKITNDTIKELADMVNAAPKKEEEGGLLGLLGFEPSARSLAIEKAEVQADIKRRLSREKKLFGVVSKSTAAKQLEKAGNRIDVESSRQTSESADLALRVFDQEKVYTGAISTALNKAAERIADGENPKKVKDETYGQVLKQIQETYSGGKGSGTGGSKTSDADDGQIKLFQELLTFGFFEFAAPKGKNCTKGYSCGKSCISPTKNCHNPLEGQAKNFADFLKLQNSAGSQAAGDRPPVIDLSDFESLRAEGEAFADKYLVQPSAEIEQELAAAQQAKNEAAKALMPYGDDIPEKELRAFLQAESKWSKVLEKRHKAVESGYKKMQTALIKEGGVSAIQSKKYVDQFNAVIPITAKSNLAEAYRTVGGSISTLNKVGYTKPRAYASDDGEMNIGDKGMNGEKEVIFHELGHHLEFSHPSLKLATNNFLYSRATSGTPKKLKELTGNKDYRDDEVALPGRFISPYVGKIYSDGSTEVLSMGIEHLTTPQRMRHLREQDPDHFDFVIGAILGASKNNSRANKG